MILFLLDDTDHLYPQFWQVRIDTFQICHMIPADVVTRLHAIDLFRMTKPFFFFLEHAGELRIFVLRRRECPIYITDHPPWARMGDG